MAESGYGTDDRKLKPLNEEKAIEELKNNASFGNTPNRPAKMGSELQTRHAMLLPEIKDEV